MHFLPLDRGFIGVLYWFCAGFKEQKVVTDDSSDSTFYNLIQKISFSRGDIYRFAVTGVTCHSSLS